MGAPGAWYRQGSLVAQPGEESGASAARLRTSAGPSATDDQYLGYALAVADFDGDGVAEAAVGLPRGQQMRGAVAVMSSRLELLKTLRGSQVGGYFGAALAAGDVSGDGRADIFVGAPLVTVRDRDGRKSSFYLDRRGREAYEAGRVSVFLAGEDFAYTEETVLEGGAAYGRFGSAVAFLGDTNGDGFGDLGVGAPYEEETGAIYIFHGKAGGIREKAAQVILGSSVDSGLRSFGFSVAGGRDVDGQGYADVWVGAHAADAAVLLRSRPVVSLASSLALDRPTLNLDRPDCSVGEKRLPCVGWELCVVYEDSGEASPPSVDVQVQLSADADSKNAQRAAFLDSRSSQTSRTLRLRRGAEACASGKLFAKTGIRDKLSPIKLSANYTLLGGRRPNSLPPVLNQHLDNEASASLGIEKNCGRDNVCVPDLRLEAALTPEILASGSSEAVTVEAAVSNMAEAAFEARLFLRLPQGLDFGRLERQSEGSPVFCAPSEEGQSLACALGNPLPKGASVKLRFHLVARDIDADVLLIDLSLNSTNREPARTLRDNSVQLRLRTETKAEVALRGASRPQQLSFASTDVPFTIRLAQEAGPSVSHVFELRNLGPSRVGRAELRILWPSFTADGEHLLYLYDDPAVSGNATCQILQQDNVNPDSLLISDRRIVKRNAQDLPRTKRSGGSLSPLSGSLARLERDSSRSLDCAELRCTEIRCAVEDVGAGEGVIVDVSSRLWLRSVAGLREGRAESLASVRVLQLGRGRGREERLPAKAISVVTELQNRDVGGVLWRLPWWVFVVAVAGGLLLLALFVLCLYKCGFFNRRTADGPPSVQAEVRKGEKGDEAAEPLQKQQAYGFVEPDQRISYTAQASQYSEDRHGPRL